MTGNDGDPAAEALGPFYDTPGLERMIGATREVLDGEVAGRGILAVTTTDPASQTLYPAWQLTAAGKSFPVSRRP